MEGVMRVSEVMTKEVQTVPPTMTADAAWELMARNRIHHLVVMTGSEVRGILSERDTGGRRGASLRARSTVADLMTTAVATTSPDATIRKVANIMRGRTIGCVPVVDGKRLVGIVTITDLLNLIGHGIDRPSKPARHALHYRAPHGKARGKGGLW
jgi:acetoin utilization protein AcuB